MNQFERNVTVEMAELDPANAKYVYLGVIDKRPEIYVYLMASEGALTRAEIDAKYPNTFSNAGGFNCRHRWARETSRSEQLIKPDKASSLIDDKKRFNPVTVEGIKVG